MFFRVIAEDEGQVLRPKKT